jgi:hypothetical protein
MEPIVYTPYFKKLFMNGARMTFGAIVVFLLLSNNTSALLFVALGVLGLLGIYCWLKSYRFTTFLVIDWNGIHVMDSKKGELDCIPWSKVNYCKFYPGIYDNPSVCVLFHSINYQINGQFLFTSDGPIDMKREGKIILCDRDLLKLSQSKLSPDEFSARNVWGITATKEQFACIRAWKESPEPLAASRAKGTDRP